MSLSRRARRPWRPARGRQQGAELHGGGGLGLQVVGAQARGARRWRVAASVGCRRRSRWPSVRRSSASLKLSPGRRWPWTLPSGVGRRGSRWGGSGPWVPGGEQSVDHDPAAGLDGHWQVLGSAVAGQAGQAWWRPASLWASVQRSTSWPVSSITVRSGRWLARSHPRCRSPAPGWATVVHCSVSRPRRRLLTVRPSVGHVPEGGHGASARRRRRYSCRLSSSSRYGPPPTVTESAAHPRTGRYQNGGPVSGVEPPHTAASRGASQLSHRSN
jgi:hypothetical protein